MDEVIRELADAAGLEFAGGKAEIPAPQSRSDELGNLILEWPDDHIEARINDIERSRRGLNCYLSVRDHSGRQMKWLCAPVRLNLMSTSAKTQLKRDLNERRGMDWATRIDQMVVAVYKAADTQRKVKVLKRRESLASRDWILDPVIERNQHTMLVAAGGTGKSILLLALMLSAVTGREVVPGIKVKPIKGNCLYMDWETDEDTHERRLTQLCDGLSIPFPEDRIHYIRMAVPLTEDVEYVHRYNIQNRIEMAGADSVGMATAGDINSQADAIAYVNAVRMIGEYLTFISIHHVGWGDATRSTGSRYFENAARSVWVLEKDQDQAEADSHLDLVHRKSNNGMLEQSIGLRMEFADTAVRYYKATVSDDNRSPRQRILDKLTDIGRLSLQALYDDLQDIKEATIRKNLDRMVNRGELHKWDGTNAKNPEYGVVEKRVSDTTSGQSQNTAWWAGNDGSF